MITPPRALSASLALALLAAPLLSRAATSASELDAIKQEIAAMRADYEARLGALEQRLKAAEAATPSAQSAQAPRPTQLAAPAQAAAATATAATAPPVAAAAAPPPATPTPAVATASPNANPSAANAFNPAIALILSGQYAHTRRDPSHYAIAGIPLPPDAEAGPGERGFSLAETELDVATNIDPWLRGAANIALSADDSVAVEEAYLQTTSLGHGLTAKAGRIFSNIGYLNPKHAHTWDFVDNPLAYQALLGTQYGDDGVQLTWLAPLDRYVELSAELGRGRSFPGDGEAGGNGAGMFSLAAHTGGDIGFSQNWRAGVSMLHTKAGDQELASFDDAGNDATGRFDGTTRVWIADAVWKWAPQGNATRTSVTLQGEYLRSRRSGSLAVTAADGTPGIADDYRATQSGWYVQGIYKFTRRWRVGLRTETLDAGSPEYGLNASAFGAGTGHTPRKNTLMFDYSPSEFSRFRIQFADDRARQGRADYQLFLQYQMSLGAHGAHSY